MSKWWCIVIAQLFILISCDDTLLNIPVVPPGNSQTTAAGNPPENIVASHGGKRRVTLSWDAVPGAAGYYIYRADSPLNTFTQCGETTEPTITFNNLQPGSTVYYRVSSVYEDGSVSRQSHYKTGSTIAQPIISDIVNITESSVDVTWYMENAFDTTYKDNLLYTVFCYKGTTEIAHIAIDGSALTENRVSFTGLGANTSYVYQVEAYLSNDQSNSEKSDAVDAATARRLRPGAPLNLTASRGTTSDSIALSFDLPEMVDIALGNNQYGLQPVYFVISRRVYSESGANDYQTICSYFGSNQEKAERTEGMFFGEYSSGETVSWIDTSIRNRGREYQYQVRSYVDNIEKIITSDVSKSDVTGWALSEGSINFSTPLYTLDQSGEYYESAALPLQFDFDSKGESYRYTLIETIEPINDGFALDPSAEIIRTIPGLSYEELRDYQAVMDLTKKTTEETLGRGVYSYTVNILLEDGTVVDDTIATIGKMRISEETNPVVVEDFAVEDGYADKFVIYWKKYSNTKYILRESFDRNTWTDVEVFDWDTVETPPEQGVYEVIEREPGIVRYFSMQPIREVNGLEKRGETVYAPAAQTLGKPALLPDSNTSYTTLAVHWEEAQKADTYRIKYKYSEGEWTVADTVKKENLDLDAAGNFKYSFEPDGYNDAAVSGREIRIMVEALNEGLREKIGSDDEIVCPSTGDIVTRLVGPAELNLAAGMAKSASNIEVSWNRVEGAGGYYVFRRQFSMDNTAEAGTETIVYYVPALTAPAIDITGKNLLVDSSNTKTDTGTVKATASYASSRYTLKDIAITDNEYSGVYNEHLEAYRNQQNDIVRGCPYRYFVVPVLSGEPLDSIEFTYIKDSANKNAAIESYSLANTRYSGAAALEKHGFTTGFGQNVIAAKGNYASSGGVNDGIAVRWDAPPLLAAAGFNPRYEVYRKAHDKTVWDKITSVDVPLYVDAPPERGVAYEYLIGISNQDDGGTASSQPKDSARFIDFCRAQKDDRNRAQMLGYMLDMVKMEIVSRDEQKEGGSFAEQVRWYSAGIKTSASSDYNWGIDGYTVYVMNRNIDDGWHEIADISSFPNQTNQSVMVTNKDGLLKVLRDYKHFFKVRSYVVKDDGEKIYCPDPPYTYSYRWGSDAYLMETDYVKWGARQISPEEFIKITSLYLADGLQKVNGNAWNTGFFGRSANAGGNYGSSGKVEASSNFGVTSWNFIFSNFKTDLQTRAGDRMTFITINGELWAGSGATNQYPQRYGDSGYFDIKGPVDTPALYTGRMKIGNPDDLYWDKGTVYVYYPAGAELQTVSFTGENTALPYSGQGNERYQQDAWR